MPRIAIVGAGQSGLVLGHLLRNAGVDVHLFSHLTSEELRQGRIGITQLSVPSVRTVEEAAGLTAGASQLGQAPEYSGVSMTLRSGQNPDMTISGGFSRDRARRGISVDRRTKMANWLELFEDRGGRVQIRGLTVSDLDWFTRRNYYDLVVIAVGGGELGQLFPADRDRTGGAHPRAVTEVHVSGLEGGEDIEVITRPEGTIFVVPVLSATGPAHAVWVASEVNGPMDCSSDADSRDPASILAAIRSRLASCAPELHQRLEGCEVTDPRAALVTQVHPAVREPVAQLPSGGHVMALADCAVSADPISGQGWANSTRCAQIVADAIVADPSGGFTPSWMRTTFDTYYEGPGQASSQLSGFVHEFWTGALKPHQQEILALLPEHPEIAERWIAGFDDPTDLQRWLFDEIGGRNYLQNLVARVP